MSDRVNVDPGAFIVTPAPDPAITPWKVPFVLRAWVTLPVMVELAAAAAIVPPVTASPPPVLRFAPPPTGNVPPPTVTSPPTVPVPSHEPPDVFRVPLIAPAPDRLTVPVPARVTFPVTVPGPVRVLPAFTFRVGVVRVPSSWRVLPFTSTLEVEAY